MLGQGLSHSTTLTLLFLKMIDRRERGHARHLGWLGSRRRSKVDKVLESGDGGWLVNRQFNSEIVSLDHALWVNGS